MPATSTWDMMYGRNHASGSQSQDSSPNKMDLPLSILKHLPTPVLVLDQNRKVLWTNWKAEALFGSADSSRNDTSASIGKDLDELGVTLLNNRSWGPILSEIEYLRCGGTSSNDENSSFFDGFQVVVNNSSKSNDQKERQFRACIDALNEDRGLHFILTFELPIFLQENPVNYRKVYGGENGCRQNMFRDALQIWDAEFTRQLSPDEYFGTVLTRTRKPFTNQRSGFINPINGDRMTTLMSGECLYDEAGIYLGAICWCEDIQEYEQYLIEKQHNLLRSHETICDLMPHLVWTARPDGYCDWYSRRWYEYTGMSKEESVGTGYEKVIYPDDLNTLREAWNFSQSEHQDGEVEVRYLRRDGVYRWMHTRACPLLDDNGKVLKWYGTNTDITDIVMSRIEAKRNKHQMLTVLAHAEVNMFCVDKNRLVTMAEGAMLWGTKTEQTHQSKENLIGKDIIEHMQSTQAGGIPGHENSILEILSGKVEMATCEEKIGDKSYRTRLVADLEHNSDDGGQAPKVIGCLGLSIDITDVEKRAQLEMDNTRLMIEEQAAKDSSKIKSQFLANMSHEMRTPTAGVIGMVDLLDEDPTLTSSQREYVSSIQLSGRALLTINLVFNYENEIDESLEVLGDPGRIRQVLSNLLTNSLKFTENGSITINAKGKRITDSGNTGNDVIEVRFVIKDTGIGISKMTLDKLFRPFSQGDSSTARLYGGTGLGLTISRNLATLMSGTIDLDSEQGVGSTATFTIPLKISSYCRLPRNPTTPAKLDFSFTNDNSHSQSLPMIPIMSFLHIYETEKRKKRAGQKLTLKERGEIIVLVVEDNAINQTIALKTVRNLGFQATAVWNGREALNYLSNPGPSNPRPDIILMDVQMPIMDGYEATKILRTSKEYEKNLEPDIQPSENTNGLVSARRSNPNGSKMESPASRTQTKTKSKLKDLPVIAMTASAIQGDQEKCLEAGMDGYLSKPVEKERLEETLLYWGQKTMNVRELASLGISSSDGKHSKNDSADSAVVMMDEDSTWSQDGGSRDGDLDSGDGIAETAGAH
ncbi:histidine kinase hhk6p [Botrytis cinerea]